MHIVLIGDSIFDNAPYVDSGLSVSEQLSEMVGDIPVSLLAVDGDVTTDVQLQMESLPPSATHLFVSCGGNDALQSLHVLSQPATTVGEALSLCSGMIQKFRQNYRSMLSTILSSNKNLTVCTIYNRVPGLSNIDTTALALFNEVILEEAMRERLPVIDLRIVFDNDQDFSSKSPIEPSAEGGRKIAKIISAICTENDNNTKNSPHCQSQVYYR